ncbi:MAG: DUF1926 domain-containing protein [Sphaerochaetaceae bacterium]|nr:DUF1926 domain-containing protein [Sphaerochaetaceae bacterium]
MSYIVGAYSQLAGGTSSDSYKHILNNAIKPLLTEVYKREDVFLQLYLGGALLQWLDTSHAEVNMLLKNLSKSNKIDMMTGSFHQAILPLVPPSDRILQIETTTNFIAKKYKKLPKTFWCYGEIWDPSLISCLSLSKIEKVIISLDNKNTFEDLPPKPFKMQEIGRSVDIIPIDTRVSKLVHDFGLGKITFTNMFSKIKSLNDSTVQVAMINLNQLCQGEITNEQVIELFTYFFDNCELSFDKLYKKDSSLDLDYLEKGWYGFDALVPKKSIHGVLYKDTSLNFLYNRIISLIEVAKLYKKNRDIKRRISKMIPKLLCGAPYLYDSNASIIKGSIRSNVYKYLIELEKILISLEDFSYPYIQDVDKDGTNEVISGGKNFNTIIDTKGGSILELKYFPARYNFINGLLPFNYDKYKDNLAKAGVKQKLFSDVLLDSNFDLKTYRMPKNKLNELKYNLEILDNKYTEFELKSDEKQSLGINIIKHYKFTSNEISLNVKIKNSSLKQKEFKFGLEMPFSFYPFENNVNVKINDEDIYSTNEKEYSAINSFRLNDKKHKTKIGVNFIEKCNLFYANSYITTRTVVGSENLYQFSLFLPTWDFKLESKESKDINLVLRIGRNI